MSKITESFRRIIPPERMAFYIDHPVEFVEDIIFGSQWIKRGGTQFVTDQQRQILESIARNRLTTVAAGRGVGKTAVLSWATEWWLACFSNARVCATAPSYPQLQSVLWPEVNKWLQQSRLKPAFEHTAKKLYLKEAPKASFAEPRTASKDESLQGLHSENLLLLMDEAPGIDDSVFDVIRGSMTSKNNKIVLMGNPVRTSGFFADSHRGKGSQKWSKIQLSSEDSPIVDREFVSEMESRYGREHSIFKTHVLGQFPTGDPDSFISLGDVEMAAMRDIDFSDGPIEIGVDVARKGDDLTVIAVRKGWKLFPLTIMPKTRTNEIVDKVIELVKEYREKFSYEDTIKIKVDESGVGGGTCDYLMLDRDNNIEVIECNFGGAGDNDFDNEATIMWARLRDNIEKISLPYDDRVLIEELASRRWYLSKRGRSMIEPKDRYKNDFHKSPDRADAVVLCFSDKKNDAKVFKHFDRVNKNVLGIEETPYGKKIVSVFVTNNNEFHCASGLWSGGQLVITETFSGDPYGASNFCLVNSDSIKVVGNKSIFDIGADDAERTFRKMGIKIKEAKGYNEHGSLALMAKMIEQGDLKTTKNCTDLIFLLDNWTYKNDKTGPDNNKGIVYSVALMLSEMKMMMDYPASQMQYNDYSTNKTYDNPNLGFQCV